MRKNFKWTIISCLAFMIVVLGLFVNRMTIDKDLNLEELKDLGAYIILPNRKLEGFSLLDSSEGIFNPEDFKGKWNVYFLGLLFVRIFVLSLCQCFLK